MYDDLDKTIDELNLDDYVDVEEETENMWCDSTGYCSGWSCPNYAKCHGLN